jgi:DNA-binding NarL/FixJ family response regulator
MNDIRICIFDSDTIRAEAIKEVLSNEGCLPSLFSTEISSLKALLEEKYDAVFVGLDFVENIIEYLVKVKNYAPESRLVAIIAGQYSDYQFTLAELGITRYIQTPVTSTDEILEAIKGIESEIMSDEEKTSFMVSILEHAKKSISDKKISKKIKVALDMFIESTPEQNKLKGDIRDIPYFEVVRLVCSLYKEGILEIVNEQDRAVLVIKNNNVVSAYVTPGVRGLKAFLRVAGWNNGSFYFKNKINMSYGLEHELINLDISKLYHLAKKTNEWFVRMNKNLPSKKLQVGIDVRMVGNNVSLTALEFDVLTTVVDHSSVSEITNYNSNVDSDIFDSLINLRRKGAIEVRV